MSAETLENYNGWRFQTRTDDLVDSAQKAYAMGDYAEARRCYEEAAAGEIAVFDTLDPSESRLTKSARSESGVRAISLLLDASLSGDAVEMAYRVVVDPDVYVNAKLKASCLIKTIDPELGGDMYDGVIGGVVRIAEKLEERGWLPKEQPQEVKARISTISQKPFEK